MVDRKFPFPVGVTPVIAILAALGLVLLGFQATQAQATSVIQAGNAQSAHNTPTPQATEPPSWIILDTLPVTATQADYGAEIYRLVCKACHGDRGQGLTGDWIVQWPPEDQNCWQAKCHHETIHPPDGFALPHFVPAVIGPNQLRRFDTALDLYEYNRATMPWHAPGTMLDREYWQVTAFLLRENEIDAGSEPLEPERAASLRLYPAAADAPQAPSTQAPAAPQTPEPHLTESSSSPSRNSIYVGAIVVLAVIGTVMIILLRRK